MSADEPSDGFGFTRTEVDAVAVQPFGPVRATSPPRRLDMCNLSRSVNVGPGPVVSSGVGVDVCAGDGVAVVLPVAAGDWVTGGVVG